MQIHNDTMKTSDTVLRKIYLPLYLKGLCVRGSWRLNRTATYWPPQLFRGYSRVSFSFSWIAQPKAWGPTLLAFSTASYQQLVWSPNSIGGPEGPFCWVVAFSTTSCYPRVWSTTNWLPVFTELYNSSIARSISPHNWPSGCVTSAALGMACLIVIERK